jgi:hypothetical protein
MKHNKMKMALAGMLVTGLVLPGVSSADWLTFEGEEKPWAVNVGTRVWMNEWESNAKGAFSLPISLVNPDNGTITAGTTASRHFTSKDKEATAIPYISARYGRFFISGSYYSETSFDFETYQEKITSGDITSSINQATNAQRSEWDTSIGYFVIKGLALTAGYKEIDMDINAADTEILINGETIPSSATGKPLKFAGTNSKNKFSGPTIGISGSVPINDSGLGLYGSYAHGFMDFKFDEYQGADGKITGASDNGADYDVAEFGITYTPNLNSLSANLPLSSASVFAGYRYQRIRYDINSFDFISNKSNDLIKNATDTTQGFVAGVNFAF